jgi:hypothetical protein
MPYGERKINMTVSFITRRTKYPLACLWVFTKERSKVPWVEPILEEAKHFCKIIRGEEEHWYKI